MIEPIQESRRFVHSFIEMTLRLRSDAGVRKNPPAPTLAGVFRFEQNARLLAACLARYAPPAALVSHLSPVPAPRRRALPDVCPGLPPALRPRPCAAARAAGAHLRAPPVPRAGVAGLRRGLARECGATRRAATLRARPTTCATARACASPARSTASWRASGATTTFPRWGGPCAGNVAIARGSKLAPGAQKNSQAGARRLVPRASSSLRREPSCWVRNELDGWIDVTFGSADKG